MTDTSCLVFRKVYRAGAGLYVCKLVNPTVRITH